MFAAPIALAVRPRSLLDWGESPFRGLPSTDPHSFFIVCSLCGYHPNLGILTYTLPPYTICHMRMIDTLKGAANGEPGPSPNRTQP